MFPMVYKQTFSEWLSEERGKRGWSQSDLARFAGLHRAVINKIETGTNPMPDTVKALAHALEYPLDFVYEKAGFLEEKSKVSPIKRKLTYLAESLPDSDLEMVIALLEQRLEFYRQNPKIKPAK